MISYIFTSAFYAVGIFVDATKQLAAELTKMLLVRNHSLIKKSTHV